MPVSRAKVINIIEVTTDSGVVYFTLEGFPIGSVGSKEQPEYEPKKPPVIPEKGGKVVKPMSPQKAREENEAEGHRTVDEILTRGGK